MDSSTAIFNLIWYVFIFCLINLIFSNLTTKIALFIVLCFPLTLISIVGLGRENILYVLTYLTKFAYRPKLYLYDKREKHQ